MRCIELVTEWVFKGRRDELGRYFAEDATWEDGEWKGQPIRPQELVDAWEPWVREVTLFLDSEGTFRHWRYGSDFSAQPACDVDVYRVIRGKWVELMNKKLEERSRRPSVGSSPSRNRR